MRTGRSASFWLWVQTALIVLVLATATALALLAWQTNKALCAFKGDLEQRYEAGLQLLADHPEGLVGISREVIEGELRNRKATLDSLDDLRCS